MGGVFEERRREFGHDVVTIGDEYDFARGDQAHVGGAENGFVLNETRYDGTGSVVLQRDYDAGPEASDYGDTEIEYYRDGNAKRIKHPTGTVTRNRYDIAGRLIKTWTKGGSKPKTSTTFDYGVRLDGAFTVGRLERVSSKRAGIHSGETAIIKDFRYTRRSQMAEVKQTIISQDHGKTVLSTRYEYDDADRLTFVGYPARNTDGTLTTEYVRTIYGEFGQAVAVDVPDANGEPIRSYVDSVSYDIYGHIRAIEYGNDVFDYWKFSPPDENNRLECIRTTTADGDTGSGCNYESSEDYQSLAYGPYDANGRVLRIDDQRSTGSVPTSEWLNDQDVVYDAVGRLSRIDYTATGKYETFGYDYIGNMTSRSNETTTVAYTYSPRHRHRLLQHGTEVLDYDNNGGRKQKGTWRYHPDNTGQIVEVGERIGTGPETLIEQSVYDEGGNRVVRLAGDLDMPVHYHAGGLFEVDENELVRYFYLGGKRVASDRQPVPSGIWQPLTSGAWDDLTPAIASTGAASAGSPRSARTTRAAAELRFASARDAAGGALAALILITLAGGAFLLMICADRRGRFAAVGALALVWTTLPLGPLAEIPGMSAWLGVGTAEAAIAAPTETLFFHTDHLGSTQVVTNQAGNKVEELRYRAFGGLRCAGGACSASPTPNARRTFTGHEPDTDAGLIYMKARHYDPEVAGFLSFDPKAVYASPYSYVGFDPLGAVDPTGESPALIFALVVAAFSFVRTITETGNVGLAVLGAALSGAGIAFAGPIGNVVEQLAQTATGSALLYTFAASQLYGAWNAAQSGDVVGAFSGMVGATSLASGLAGSSPTARAQRFPKGLRSGTSYVGAGSGSSYPNRGGGVSKFPNPFARARSTEIVSNKTGTMELAQADPAPECEFPPKPKSGAVANIEGWRVEALGHYVCRGVACAIDAQGQTAVFDTIDGGGVTEVGGAGKYWGRVTTNASSVFDLKGTAGATGFGVGSVSQGGFELIFGDNYQGFGITYGPGDGLLPFDLHGGASQWTLREPVP